MKRVRNLTLTQALESGRPLKRFMDYSWRENEEKMSFTQEDIRATDWEVKPEPVRLKIYLSPDKTKVSLDVNSPYDWDCLTLVEEDKS